MIKSSFKRNTSGRIISFEVTGHADAGPYGSDIVCAATSALAVSAVNGIEALAGVTPIVEVNEEEGGYLYTEVPAGISQEQRNITQLLLENLLLGLQAIEQEHEEYIEVKTINNN